MAPSTGRLTLEIAVMVGGELSVLGSQPETIALIAQQAGHEIAGVLRALGIPAEPAVTLTVAPADSPADPAWHSLLRLSVAGRPCLFPWSLARQVHGYVTRQPQLPDVTPAELDARALADWIAVTCREAVKGQPALLLTAAAADHYCREAALPVAHADELERAHRVLQGVVGLGRSIADRAAVSKAFADAMTVSTGASGINAMREALLTALPSPRLVVRVAPAYLRQVTTDFEDAVATAFAGLRQEFHDTLGIALPDVGLAADASLPHGTFSFQVNDLTTLPVAGLSPGKSLVTQPADQLRELGIEAEPARVAATLGPAAIIDRDHEAAVKSAGLVAYGQLRYLVASFGHALRQRSYQLIDRTAVIALLANVGRSIPWLKLAAESVLSVDLLTTVLRELAFDSVSIHDMPLILQALIDHQATAEPAGPVGEARDLEGSINAVSAAMRADISIAGQLEQTVPLLVLDPRAEEAIAVSGLSCDSTWLPSGVDAQLAADIANALTTELGRLATDARSPILLTGQKARRSVRSALRGGFPELPVIGHDDLPFAVQPEFVEMVSLSPPA